MKEESIKTTDEYGTIRYKLNGRLHNTDGPAIIHKDGSKKYWYINGLLHREDGPAIEWTSKYKAWYLNGMIHREDGPAIEYSNGDKEWYLDDIQYTEKDFNNKFKGAKKMLTSFEKLSKAIERITPSGAYRPFIISDYIDEDKVSEWSFDGITEALQYHDDFFLIEIIGYREAVDYLIENDVSFTETFGILAEYGFEISTLPSKRAYNMSSELMAGMLAGRNHTNAWYEIDDKINDLAREYGNYLEPRGNLEKFLDKLISFRDKSIGQLEMDIYLSPYDKYKKEIVDWFLLDSDKDVLIERILKIEETQK